MIKTRYISSCASQLLGGAMCFYPLLQFFDPLPYIILKGRVKPLQLLTHDIETLCQLLNLVPGMDVYAMVKVSTCNDFCAVLEFLYGSETSRPENKKAQEMPSVATPQPKL